MTATGDIFPATGMPDRDWWAALWPDPAATLKALGVTADMTVLDLCCGDGWFTAPLALLTGGKVFALDLDPAMLEAARAEADRVGATILDWIEGDARDTGQLLPQRVDFVLIANTFHGVPDQTGLAKAAAEALAPHGRFAVVNWHALPREETTILGSPRGPKSEMRMSPKATSAVVEPAGFKLEKVVELPPYHYGAVFRRQS